MNGRFYYFGCVASLVFHGLLFAFLAFISRDAEPVEETPGETPPVVTNAVSNDEGESLSPTAVPPPADSPSAVPLTAERPAGSGESPGRSGRDVREEPSDAPSRAWKGYVVKSGDTLTILAKRYGCSSSEIAKKNKKSLAQMAKLRIGQRILLPIE